MDPNKYYDLEQETIQRYFEYNHNVNERINNMWNLILYNQFINEEVRCLHRKIYFLEDDLRKEKNKNERLLGDIFSLEDKVEDYEEKEQKRKERKNNKRNAESIDWLESEKNKKPKNYDPLSTDTTNEKLLDLFKNLKSLKDIINFENNINKYDFFENKKFEKLYKLIPSCKELISIIGMNEVKEKVFNQISYFLHGLNNPEEINHIVITGEPGVGKTTIAKIIGKIYLAMNFLKNDNFISARRSDLIAEYCGQTAVKTQKVIDSAEGGVLFIDEVYSLGNPEKRDVFTKECIDTINQNLTEKSDKFLCIIAGYEEEVNKCFFNYNKGLERRFPIRFNIPSYTCENLRDILLKFIKDEKWNFDEKDKLLNLIKKYKDILKFQAGDLRTILQYAKEKYSLRIFNNSLIDDCGNKTLSLEDLKFGFEKLNILREEKEESSITHWYI